MPSQVSSPHRVRLFKSERLEKLTLISPRTFAVSWAILLPLIAWTGWGSATLTNAAALMVAGLLAWTLFEYVMHRYLFHLESRFAPVRWVVFLMHGNHHETPGDPLRGLMPLPVSVSVGAVLWVVSVAVLGPAGTWLLLGFMTGYVIYDALHYACHQLPMRRGLGAVLKRHHMRHHHIDEGGNFAISAIFWDRVFGSRITSLKR
ncbi:fatty acid hydroxylase [Novosphingobium sp. FGD1]|uniref:Fatty acid hydroxylase n=1 Tax=Novosphingobium silvae TaxID=2692619 RepID=A0A7X4K7A9_9SPHN|nr:sterol desaturase family protein [Novosphingobium silvae]MYL98901.1 fatty acid hydroxylase [Novosphingobium silvae]